MRTTIKMYERRHVKDVYSTLCTTLPKKERITAPELWSNKMMNVPSKSSRNAESERKNTQQDSKNIIEVNENALILNGQRNECLE